MHGIFGKFVAAVSRFYLALGFGVVALADDDSFGAVTGFGLSIVTPSNFFAMDKESSLVVFAVVVVVVFVRVPVAVVLVVFGLFFSEAAFVPAAVPTIFVVAVALFGSLFTGSSLPLFVAAAAFVAGAAVFFGCAADCFGSVVGDGDANVFFGGSIFFVDELSNFRAISNESKSNESRFSADGFVAFLVGAVFLPSLAFDLPAASVAVFS